MAKSSLPSFRSVIFLSLLCGALAHAQAPDAPIQQKADEPLPTEAPKPELTLAFPMPKFSGLIQVWALYDQTNYAKANFRIRRTELKVTGQVSPEIRYFVMIDPSKSLKDGAAVSKNNDNKILQDVGIGYTYIEGLEFTIGQFKTPTSAEGLLSSADLNLPERSLVGRSFGDKRETGAMISYKYYIFKLSVMGSNGGNANTNDNNTQKDLHGRLDVAINENISVGTFASYIDSSDIKTHKNGANVAAKFGHFFVNGEAGTAKIEGIKNEGFYVDAGYECQKLKPVLRYEYFKIDTVTANIYSAGLSYTLVPAKAKVQVAYSYLKNASTDLGTPKLMKDQDGSLAVANFQVTF